MEKSALRMLEKFQESKKTNRVLFESLFEECYEYAMPMRQKFLL